MKIEYRFVTGEIVELELDDALGAELAALAQKQENRNRAETRRHDSYEAMLEAAYPFAGADDVQQAVDDRLIAEHVRAAVGLLTEKQQRLVFLQYVKGYSIPQIANLDNVSHQSLYEQHAAMMKKLKKLLINTLQIPPSRG